MSPIGFGTWPLGGQAYGPVVAGAAVEALSTALDSGIRLFDTADIYGNGRAEEFLGRVISKHPDTVIVSKAGYLTENGSEQSFSATHLRSALEGSLRRLGRDELDVFLLHSPLEAVLASGDAFLVLDRLREEGLVKRTGVSLRTVDSWNLALKWPQCEVVEVILNLLDQRPMDAGLLDRAAESNIDVIARVPLCFGFLSGKHTPGASFEPNDQRSRWPRVQLDAWIEAAERYRFLERNDRSLAQSALAFCCCLPGVRWVIPGMKSVGQVLHNVRGGWEENRLSIQELQTVRRVWQCISHLPPGSTSKT